MKITIICEGNTEKAFKPCLHDFLIQRLSGKMPSLTFDVHNGSIPTEKKLKRVVRNLLLTGRRPSDAVIALTDVYPAFADSTDAKRRLRQWVGKEPRFHPHVALHDFEAWLLPYWDRIKQLAGSNSAPFEPIQRLSISRIRRHIDWQRCLKLVLAATAIRNPGMRRASCGTPI